MIGSFPGAATFWTAYTGARTFLTPILGGKSDAAAGLVNGMAAGLADVAVVAVRNPFEVVKQQMQAGMHSSTVGAFKHIVKHQGVSGLYAGNSQTARRAVQPEETFVPPSLRRLYFHSFERAAVRCGPIHAV